MPMQAEANLSALIESSDDPIWSVDREYRLLTFNSAFQRATEQNFGVSSAIGMAPHDYPPRAHGEIWPPLYRRALLEGPYRLDFQMSSGRFLEMSFNPILVDGKPEGVSVFAKDVTQRREAEHALQSAESRYRDLFDGAVEGMFLTSLIDDSRSLNVALARMLGWESPKEMFESLKNSPVDAWADPADRALFRAQLYEQGSVQGFETLWKRKDGSFIWVSLSSRMNRDSEGKPVSHQGFVKDITERKQAETLLRDSEARFRATFEQAAVGITHVSFGGEILACNPCFAEMLGYSQEELRGQTVMQITPPGYIAQSEEILLELAACEPGYPSWEKPYLRKDGSLTWVRLTASIQRDGQGRPLHHIAFVEDINAQRAAELALHAAAKALQASEARYRTVFQTILDAIVVIRSGDGALLDVNEAFLKVTGFEREEVIGKAADEVSIWADPRDRRKMAEVLNSNSTARDIELRLRKKTGDPFWGSVSASVVELDGVPCVIAVIKDISDVKAAQDKIRDLAFFDPLTRLPNRRLLLDRLQQSLTMSTRNPRKLALLFVDLDNFKILNDTQGHQTGDLLLQEVARRLSASVRESDTVARLGGDEFALMLDGLSGTAEDAAAHAKSVAEKIFEAISRVYDLNSRELHIQTSIGITVFGTPHRNPDEILQQAEIAMYQAKAAGRNAIRFFSPSLQAAVNARASLEEDLRLAIKEKQFVLYYQPQVDSHGLIGAEALIRWNHPTRGILLPGEFIPLAEETGLILGIGSWSLEEACAQVAEWAKHADMFHFSVAVNISARQFRQPDFVEQVLVALDRTGANPLTIKLELTESMLVENIEDIIAKMTELRAHGLSFSLDDFGTGYSSLSYLKRLPLDQLKIDRAFVRDILNDVSSGAIAQTIISLSRAMGLSVIAEGVESEGQRDFLMSLGCSSFQGFLYSRALPVNEFEKRWMVPAQSPVPSAR